MANVGPLPASQGPSQNGMGYPGRESLGADLSPLLSPNGQSGEAAIRKLLGANKGYVKYDRLAAGYGNDNAAVEALNLTAIGPDGRYNVTGAAGTLYEPIFRDPNINRGPSEPGDEFGVLPDTVGSVDAAIITDIPTSSTNYSRPRTVAAGYDESKKTMTVVFRDGTFYNYYEVTPQEWSSFYASYSKGSPWLNRGHPKGKNGKPPRQTQDGLFVNKPRGYADVTTIDPRVLEQLYRVSRAQQISSRPSSRRKRYSGGVT